MTKPALRTLLILLATIFAIATPIIQNAFDLGLSASGFAEQGDDTLRAAGYAFSIWSVIYAGLLAYAVWQALPRTPETPLLRAVAWPSVVGIAGCGLWIIVSTLNWRWASVAVIAFSAAAIILALWRAASESRHWIVDWPLGLLGGWLTAATALNVAMVLTAEGLAGAPVAMATTALSAVAAVALTVIARTGSLPYALAVLWALAAVWVAERGDNPTAAWLAVGWAAVVILGGLYFAKARRT